MHVARSNPHPPTHPPTHPSTHLTSEAKERLLVSLAWGRARFSPRGLHNRVVGQQFSADSIDLTPQTGRAVQI